MMKTDFSKFSIPKERLTEKVSKLANMAKMGREIAGNSIFLEESNNCNPKKKTKVTMKEVLSNLRAHWKSMLQIQNQLVEIKYVKK